MVARDPASGDDDRIAPGLERLGAVGPMAADDASGFLGEAVYPMVEMDLQTASVLVCFEAWEERENDALAGTPHDVKTRHRVTGHVVASLGPVHGAEEAHVPRGEPIAHLFGASVYVRFSPSVWPNVGRVELPVAHPVAHGEIDGVLDAVLSLLGRVDEKHPAERPEREPAKAVTRSGVEHHDSLAGVE